MDTTDSLRAKRFKTAGKVPQGLHRQAMIGMEPATTVKNLFSDLRRISPGEFIGEDVDRHLQGVRVIIDRDEGHGSCEFYRLDDNLYVIVTDSTYDSPRFEFVPGEGLVEFHLRISGVLDMSIPGRLEPLKATGPCLLMFYQPEGVDACERVRPNRRDVAVSLFCKPEYIAGLLRRNSIVRWPMLDEIAAHEASKTVWYRSLPLSPGLLYVAKSLLQNRYRDGIRLLYAEAKSLELICEVLSSSGTDVTNAVPTLKEAELRKLESARQLLVANLSQPLSVVAVARAVGMSATNLKRRFKAGYGVTIFEFSLDCRMRHAFYLLSSRRLSVEQVAHEVGYRHPTSFSSAFRNHFGFLPRNVKSEAPN